VRQGKQIHASDVGKALIAALPEDLSRPDMTAHWESQLDAISRKAFTYQGFMQPLVQALPPLMEQIRPQALSGVKAAPKGRGRRTGGKRSARSAAGGRKRSSAGAGKRSARS